MVPSAHGDSVGRDTLVIDTVGVKVGPYTMIDRLGTSYTDALHVVERYRLIDCGAAVEAQSRGFKEWPNIPAYPVDPDYKGKGLQLEFTVEDEGVFTMPWKGRHSLSEDRGAAPAATALTGPAPSITDSNMTGRVLPHSFVHDVQRALGVVCYADD